MRVLMTGGGTGGHVNPAIAIANSIRDNQPGSVIEFVGTSRGIENKLVPKEGYKLHHVEVQGFKRKLTPYNIKSAWLAFTSPIKAKKLIREFKPDIVIGTGGYVCWPLLKAASSMGSPTAIHEPMIPIIIPSIMKGQRINQSVAPTNFIMLISFLLV